MRGLEVAARVADELAAGTAPEEAIAARQRQVADLLAPFDAVHALAHVMFEEAALDPESYVESEHEGSAYVVELIAASLLRRESRHGVAETSPAIDGRLLGAVDELAREATQFEVLRRGRNAGASDSPEGAARSRAARQNLVVRGPGWYWQEYALLRDLFTAQDFAARLKSALGFDAEEAIRCCEAMTRLIPSRVAEHMQAARASASDFGPSHPAHSWAAESLTGWQEADDEMQALGLTALWALNTLGDALLVDGEALSREASVEPEAASRFLEALSLPMGQAADDWFGLAEQVRLRPYVAFGDGQYLLTVPGNDLWALRGVLEAVLKDAKPYRAHRARYLEQRSTSLLEAALRPEETHLAVQFDYVDEQAEHVSGEIDGLIRCGDTVILVEGKGATMRPGARRGGEALLRHLQDNLTKAIEQGQHAKEAIRRGALLKDGKPLELGAPIREVHPVVVTLDDLSAMAPVLWQLEGSKVLPEGVTLPWVVTLHELDLVAATIEWPVQFIHFLRRRSRLNQRGGVDAHDELDWWMHYLFVGLYFDNEPHDALIRLTSFTDPLDAWALYDAGIRETPAEKPRMRVDARTRAFLDLLCAERPDGWVPAGCSLLEPNGEARQKFWREAERLRRRAGRRKAVQRMTLGFDETGDAFLLCVVAVPDPDRDRMLAALEQLVDQRLDELGVQRVVGFGMSASGKRPYEALLVLEHGWWEPERQARAREAGDPDESR